MMKNATPVAKQGRKAMGLHSQIQGDRQVAKSMNIMTMSC